MAGCLQLTPVAVGLAGGEVLRLRLRLRLRLSLGFGVGSRIRIRGRGGFGIRLGRCRGRSNIAPFFVPLHVPHTSDGLDLRCSGSPVIPVLEVSMLKHILAPSVAWIHVSHPPLRGRERVVYHISDSNKITIIRLIKNIHPLNHSKNSTVTSSISNI